MSREEAIRGCRDTKLGANLVSIPDLKTNEFVRSIMIGVKSWIALEQKNGEWIWPDGSSNSFKNWATNPNQPSGDGDFAEIYSSGKWNDLGEEWRGKRNLRGSVCQIEFGKAKLATLNLQCLF